MAPSEEKKLLMSVSTAIVLVVLILLLALLIFNLLVTSTYDCWMSSVGYFIVYLLILAPYFALVYKVMQE
jgi:hypothetical protein